jgi:hypothetical protein
MNSADYAMSQKNKKAHPLWMRPAENHLDFALKHDRAY